MGEGLLSGIYRQYINSWRPYDFSNVWMSFVFFSAAILLYFIVKKNENDRKLELMRAFGFWSVALISRIYMPYAIMSTFLLLGFLDLKTNINLSKVVNVILLIVSVAIFIIKPSPNNIDLFAQDEYPVKATTYIKEQNLDNVFNDHGWGGYLLFKDIPVYMDGRNDVYRKILEDYINIVEMKVPVSESVINSGAKTVITKESSRLDVYFSDRAEWRELYRDNISVIYGLE